MTLLELMVALAILGLTATLAFSEVGPWLRQSRASAEEAQFWRALGPAQLILAELTTGAVDPDARSLTQTEARFRTLAPRLSRTPIEATLTIRREGASSRLVFTAPLLARDSVILEAPAPLRFATASPDALVVEIEHAGTWRPLVSAAFATDAPFVCAFDPIPRSCR